MGKCAFPGQLILHGIQTEIKNGGGKDGERRRKAKKTPSNDSSDYEMLAKEEVSLFRH